MRWVLHWTAWLPLHPAVCHSLTGAKAAAPAQAGYPLPSLALTSPKWFFKHHNFHTPAQLGKMTGKEYEIISLLSKPESANPSSSLVIGKNSAWTPSLCLLQPSRDDDEELNSMVYLTSSQFFLVAEFTSAHGMIRLVCHRKKFPLRISH